MELIFPIWPSWENFTMDRKNKKKVTKILVKILVISAETFGGNFGGTVLRKFVYIFTSLYNVSFLIIHITEMILAEPWSNKGLLYKRNKKIRNCWIKISKCFIFISKCWFTSGIQIYNIVLSKRICFSRKTQKNKFLKSLMSRCEVLFFLAMQHFAQFGKFPYLFICTWLERNTTKKCLIHKRNQS